jgi:anti-anti-sigma factor
MALRLNKKAPAVETIVVSGRLDGVESASLRATMNEHLSKGTNRIVVDLSEVEFVDSAGLATLVIGMKRARLEDGDVRLVTPKHDDAKRVFELTKFDDVFTMADDVELAHKGW